jgi:hypothetical protein
MHSQLTVLRLLKGCSASRACAPRPSRQSGSLNSHLPDRCRRGPSAARGSTR